MNGLCLLLGYSRQAYYKQITQTKQRLYQEQVVLNAVQDIRKDLPKTGTIKLIRHCTARWQQQGIKIGRDKTFKLLRENNLLLRRHKRSKPQTTWSKHWLHKYPDLVKGRSFSLPNELWVADITYLPAAAGKWYYASLITDAVTKQVVGFNVSASLDAFSTTKALEMAIKKNPDAQQTIHHSDRGIQYCSKAYVAKLEASNIQISMTETSLPTDNAIAERINGILKNELILPFGPILNLEHAKKVVAEAVKKHNGLRLHQHLDYTTPDDFCRSMTTSLSKSTNIVNQ